MCQLEGKIVKRIISKRGITAFKVFETHETSTNGKITKELYSLVKSTLWERGVRIQAECFYFRYGPNGGWHNWNPNRCYIRASKGGIYAFNSEKEARQQMLASGDGDTIRKVKLSGKILVYKNGYRAQFCEVPKRRRK